MSNFDIFTKENLHKIIALLPQFVCLFCQMRDIERDFIWPQTGATHYHTHTVWTSKVLAIIGLVVCNG